MNERKEKETRSSLQNKAVKLALNGAKILRITSQTVLVTNLFNRFVTGLFLKLLIQKTFHQNLLGSILGTQITDEHSVGRCT